MITMLRLSGPDRRIAWYYALALPLGATLIDIALLRSVWRTYRDRGIRWRGHHYPLKDLRSHIRHRNAWTRAAFPSGTPSPAPS